MKNLVAFSFSKWFSQSQGPQTLENTFYGPNIVLCTRDAEVTQK